MKMIFEDYGKVILVVFVVILLIGVIFGGIKIIDVMGDAAAVESNLSHSKSEEELASASARNKPSLTVADGATTHLYLDKTFKPLASVSCVDADGASLTATVVKILYLNNEDKSQTDVSSYYDIENDVFDIATALSSTGTLAVTYKAVDSYNLATIHTIYFVVDVAQS